MSTISAEVLEGMLERVDANVTQLFEDTDTVAALIKATGREEVLSEKLYRFPLQKYRGGVYGKYDANNGVMNDGSGPVITKMTAGFINSELGYELSFQSMFTTDSSDKAVFNTLAETIEGSMEEHDVYDDIGFHNDGTGVVTDPASAGTANSITFDTGSVGTNRVRAGMRVRIYDSSAGDFMADDATIDSVYYATNTVTFTANTSVACDAGDYLVITGITTNPPASFGGDYPLVSLTADDWRHGLYYFNDYTAANYVLGILKSTLPELIPAHVDGAASDISFAMGQQILDELQNRRNPQVTNGIMGLADTTQRAKIFDDTRSITTFFRTGSEIGESVDNNPSNNSYTDKFQFCGMAMTIDKRQNSDRLDFIVPTKWGRAVAKPAGYLRNAAGGYIFEGRASTGALKASQLFKITASYDFFSEDPGCAGVIDNLATA